MIILYAVLGFFALCAFGPALVAIAIQILISPITFICWLQKEAKL